MPKFKNSDRNDQSALIDDTQLAAVVGGKLEDYLSPQLRLAFHPVGGWTMPDPFARPTLGRVTLPT
jgi:hypothetical protein